MTTCENCGADTVDARGVCRTCGWRADDYTTVDDESPSLGATRAADAAGLPRGDAQWSAGASPSRASATAQYGAPSGGTPPPPRGAGTSGTARFCGTCGARLEPGEAFCGQCGTPVGAGGDYTRSVPSNSTSRYYVGGNATWSGAGDAYTEEYSAPPLPPAAPYTRPSTPGGGAYVQPGFGTPLAPGTAGESRAGRVIFGLLCILGSLISAAGAVYLAVVH